MGSSCESGSSSSRRPSSERRDVAAVPGDSYQQVSVAPSSRLGGYRDSGDDEASFEAATSQTAAFAGTAGLFEFRLEIEFRLENLHARSNFIAINSLKHVQILYLRENS